MRSEEKVIGSGSALGPLDWPDGTVHAEGLQPKRVFAFGNHGQRDGSSTRSCMEMFGFEPGAEARIVNLGLVLPEIGREAALNPQMIQL